MSVLASAQLPMFGFVLSKYVFALALPIDTSDNIDIFRQQNNEFFYCFIALCIGIGVTSGYQKLYFGLGGENLTLKLRTMLFESILRKHVGWFDDKNRAPGILSNMISEDI